MHFVDTAEEGDHKPTLELEKSIIACLDPPLLTRMELSSLSQSTFDRNRFDGKALHDQVTKKGLYRLGSSASSTIHIGKWKITKLT